MCTEIVSLEHNNFLFTLYLCLDMNILQGNELSYSDDSAVPRYSSVLIIITHALTYVSDMSV